MGTHAIQVPSHAAPCRHCGEAAAKAPVQRLQASRAFAAEGGPAASAETAGAGAGFAHDLARISVRAPHDGAIEGGEGA